MRDVIGSRHDERPMKKFSLIPVSVVHYCSLAGRSMDGQNANEWMSRCCGRTRRPYGKRLSSVACFLLLFLMLVLGSRKLTVLFFFSSSCSPAYFFLFPSSSWASFKYFSSDLLMRRGFHLISSSSSSTSSIAISPTVLDRNLRPTEPSPSSLFPLAIQTPCAPVFSLLIPSLYFLFPFPLPYFIPRTLPVE